MSAKVWRPEQGPGPQQLEKQNSVSKRRMHRQAGPELMLFVAKRVSPTLKRLQKNFKGEVRKVHFNKTLCDFYIKFK